MTKIAFNLSILLCWLMLFIGPGSTGIAADANAEKANRPNVLFIIVDDLRPELGCYGIETIHTPNIDALAEQSLTFDRAYCQQAVCMASRHSLLSGFRPDMRKIWTKKDVREDLMDIDFFPGHFRKQGYHTIGIGKVAHNSWEDPRCWSEPHLKPKNIAYEYRTHAGRKLVERMQREAEAEGKPDPFRDVVEKIRRGMAWEMHDVDDSELGDGQIADLALKALDRSRDRNAPLFLAVGFLRPHLPFVAPKKYWDLYEADQLPQATIDLFPEGAPREADNNSRELLKQYRKLPNDLPLDLETKRKLVHGYYASVSYVDAQIGRVLSGLRDSGLDDNTIIILTSDHGFQLGDQNMWGKATNFELSTRVPLLIRAPGMTTAGQRTDSLAELLDIYPTLCDLAGLPTPDHVQGTSIAQLMHDPELDLHEVAVSQYTRPGTMGHSVRTRDFRYTEWRKLDGGEFIHRALYDLREHPIEQVNVVDKKELADVVTRMSALLDRERDERVFD